MNTTTEALTAPHKGREALSFLFPLLSRTPNCTAGSITTPLTTEPYLWQESKNNYSYIHLPGKVFCCYLDSTYSHHSMVHETLLLKKYRGILFCLNQASRSNRAARIGSSIKYCLVHLLSRTLSARFLPFIIPAVRGGNKELRELH